MCRGGTNHAETVELVFDEEQISYEELLAFFWTTHNPAQKKGVFGFDRGSQYRSAIFCSDKEQYEAATASRDALERELRERGLEGLKISTEISMLSTFWRAEEYHQQYYAKKGYSRACKL